MREAFCAPLSRHHANPIPSETVAETRAVIVPATATGRCFVPGQRCATIAPVKAQKAATSAPASVVCAGVQCTA